MDERYPMALIEAYYAVAAHIKDRAQAMLETAETLERAADGMSEARIHESKPPSHSANEQAK